MLFSTTNTERMRILAAGNIGVGIALPTNVMHLHRTTGVVV
jgi:hypothetical protein